MADGSRSPTAAKTTIDLLKGDDVGAELANHPDDAIGPRNAVHTAAFVDVVGCDLPGDLKSFI